MLQNCASECVNNRTYRTLQETCDEGAPCSSGQGSEAWLAAYISRLYPPTVKRQELAAAHVHATRSCAATSCCMMPS